MSHICEVCDGIGVLADIICPNCRGSGCKYNEKGKCKWEEKQCCLYYDYFDDMCLREI